MPYKDPERAKAAKRERARLGLPERAVISRAPAKPKPARKPKSARRRPERKLTPAELELREESLRIKAAHEQMKREALQRLGFTDGVGAAGG